MTTPITGKDLISWGFTPAKWFTDAIREANVLKGIGYDDDVIRSEMMKFVPEEIPEVSMRTNAIHFDVFLDATGEREEQNRRDVIAHMDALMRLPVVSSGAVMPDACPSGSVIGTIPVGGVVSSQHIHPGMHSADICCSVAISVFEGRRDPARVMDMLAAVTHFGPGGRGSSNNMFPRDLMARDVWRDNRFLRDLDGFARGHFATQGDGNHFAYVGFMKSTGQLCLVTHHGSRGLGAQLYKRGMAVAQRHTSIVAPRVAKHNAWIDAESEDGRAYWSALQLVREWTKQSHYAIHDLLARKIGAKVADRFWNEHNFVFRRTDGLFYHAKGSTPSFDGFAEDDSGLTLIPLNCSQPVLITKHKNGEGVRGFAPHGAGRNFSRTEHLKKGDGVAELEQLRDRGLDIRSYCGKPDYSELPSAYKDADAVRSQIEKFGLAEVVDEVLPYGSIMAGDWSQDAPWKKKRKK